MVPDTQYLNINEELERFEERVALLARASERDQAASMATDVAIVCVGS